MSETELFAPDCVIYHGGCYDGFTAAWLIWRRWPDTPFIPATYGKELPMPTDAEVLMVDFSYDRDRLIYLRDTNERLVVLDHHKTAKESLAGLPWCEFDMNRSGAQMTWDWLGLGEPRHWLVDHVGDRDLWKMEMRQTPHVHAYYTSVPMTFEAWDKMSKMGRDNAVKSGKAIRQSIDRYCEKVSEESHVMRTPHGDTIVVNAPYLNASELASYMLKNTPEVRWSVAWFFRGDRRFQYSLRSREDFDVSSVAKGYGGGGHKGAAGFDSEMPPWELWK